MAEGFKPWFEYAADTTKIAFCKRLMEYDLRREIERRDTHERLVHEFFGMSLTGIMLDKGYSTAHRTAQEVTAFNLNSHWNLASRNQINFEEIHSLGKQFYSLFGALLLEAWRIGREGES